MKQCVISNTIDVNSVGLSVMQIQKDISNYIYNLHCLANLKFGNILPFATYENFNYKMVNPATNTLRIQKFIRIACQHILTEREIRKETKHWESAVGEQIKNTDIDRGFCRYWSKKILIFQYRLYKTLTKNAQQIVHLAEPKTYFQSRRARLDNDFYMYRTKSRNVTIHEQPLYVGEQCTAILGYDTYMQNHLSWSNIFHQQPTINRLISETLLQDITNALKGAIDSCPEKIKKDKKRFEIYKFNASLMQEFAMHSSRLPADQSLDRHFTINKEGQMSYSPAKKPTYMTSNGNWLSGAERMITKFGKGVRKLFATYPDTIEESIIEHICNQLKAKHTFAAEMVVVSGEDIRHWYHENNTNYTVNTGTLAGSCMRYDRCQPYLDIYVENPDKIKMLICRDNDKIIGRALLWHDDNGDKAFMDRIYGADKTIAACKSWASKNGYLYKNNQSYRDKSEFITTTGQLVDRQFIITLNKPTSAQFPYADTMARMIIDGDFLKVTNQPHDAFDNCFILDITGGRLYGYGGNTPPPRRTNLSHPDMGWQSEDDEDTIIFHNGEYHMDECGYCEHYDGWFHEDDLCYVESDNCYYHSDQCYWVGDYAFYNDGSYDCHVWSECEDENLWTDDAYSIADSNYEHMDYCSAENCFYSDYHGVSFHEEDAFYCPVTEDYEHVDNTKEIEIDGTTYEVADFCSYDDVEEYHYNNN
tara:strand:- start:315 stop:2420 length:2106 start_codon:yes stop_codon:yes gene_type:complete